LAGKSNFKAGDFHGFCAQQNSVDCKMLSLLSKNDAKFLVGFSAFIQLSNKIQSNLTKE
jgi:hypothetical protein